MADIRNSQIMPRIPLLIAVCLVVMPAHAKYGGSGMAGSAATSTYVFVPDQSTVVQTGGIAYVHRTYSIEGQFDLTVDPNAGTASFAHVDANATDDSPFKRTLDPNHVFNMASLVGTVVDDATVKFTGKASDGSDILITLTIQDDLAHLIGQTTPPPNSADFFIFSLDAVAQRKYGGSGTAHDPYQIATAEDLLLLGDSPLDYDKHFILTADIDLDPNLPGRKVFDKAVIAPATWTPYGFQGTLFKGVFDADGHTISHLTIRGAHYLGLFGRLASGAQVKNLRVVDVNTTGSGYYVGGLVGSNGGSVTQCYSAGVVSGNVSVGGLVGFNYDGSVTQCYSTGVVSGTSSVGGLVGANGGTVTQCYSTGAVDGNVKVGGLVGDNVSGSVTGCYSTGVVSGTGWGVGGLVGYNYYGTVSNSYSTGAVSASDRVGGLVGQNEGGDVTQCHSTGAVSGNWAVGGLVGDNGDWGDVTHCYSTCAVTGSDSVGGLVGINEKGHVSNCHSTGVVSGTGWGVGGLVGRTYWGSVGACFWDMQTSGQAKSDGGTGETTLEMQMGATFLDAGWDFVGEMENGTENIWAICEGLDYPKLAWQFLIADFNGDGRTDFVDFCIFGQRWLGTDSSFWCPGGGTDLTNDAFVDFEDLIVLADNWVQQH